MKILKPGKVEQRKFVCPACECEFVTDRFETAYLLGGYVHCPCCKSTQGWSEGEPYEEPVQDDRERLAQLLASSPMGTTAATEYLLSHGVTFTPRPKTDT